MEQLLFCRRCLFTYVLRAKLCKQKSFRPTLSCLRCPETRFISHEKANILLSVLRVVQGEAKTPKIMRCCRAVFAFLHALKIGTFRRKVPIFISTVEMNIRMSVQNVTFRSPRTVNLLFPCMFLNDAHRELQKNIWFRAQNSAKYNFLPPCLQPI